MEFAQALGSWGGSALGFIIPFLFVLTIVVFFHELGHFWVARRCGVRVEAFSLGFGPELFGWNDKHGTRWKFSAIPLGGYVRFFGDADAASTPDMEAAAAMNAEERAVSYLHKSVGARSAIVAAGPIANFILAIVIFAFSFALAGKVMIAPRVDTVNAGSAAERAGFAPGDLVVRVDGDHIESFSDLQRIVSGKAGVPLAIVVDRQGREVTLNATPDIKELKDRHGRTYQIGMLGLSRPTAASDIVVRRYGPIDSVRLAVKETWFVAERTLTTLWRIIAGRESASQLGGPISIAQYSKDALEASGFAGLFLMAAWMSVSIGLLNLFPVPMLDGGHLVFYAYEAVMGRPMSPKTLDYSFRVGFALVLMLMLFSTWNDLKILVG